MDPNLFHIDWERTLEALVGIIVLSFLVERVCALVFESRWYIRLFDDKRVGHCPPNSEGGDPEGDDGGDDQPPAGRLYPIKEIGAFALAALTCWIWDFDAVSIIFLREQTHWAGTLITAGVIAGGSKASIKLFHDLMKIRSAAEVERKKLRGGG